MKKTEKSRMPSSSQSSTNSSTGLLSKSKIPKKVKKSKKLQKIPLKNLTFKKLHLLEIKK